MKHFARAQKTLISKEWFRLAYLVLQSKFIKKMPFLQFFFDTNFMYVHIWLGNYWFPNGPVLESVLEKNGLPISFIHSGKNSVLVNCSFIRNWLLILKSVIVAKILVHLLYPYFHFVRTVTRTVGQKIKKKNWTGEKV